MVIKAVADETIMEATGVPIRHISDPLTLELMAIRHALLLISSDPAPYSGTIRLQSDCAEAWPELDDVSWELRRSIVGCRHNTMNDGRAAIIVFLTVVKTRA
ncbi:hypothetical protein LINGRAHAP2_LOCUS29907, partial [Linum grandiflorum]